MTDCIFCRIIAGDIPSQTVYEDESVYAFRDIAPQAPSHILIVPKQHIESISALNEGNAHLAAQCLVAAAKIAEKESLGSGFRIIANTGLDAGQTVFHLHFHLLGGRPLGEKLAL